jgi:DNA-binding transcriptional ArsR family regulator
MPQLFYFSDTDLAKIRFAFSPLWECVSSLRVLQNPSMGAMHLPWIKEAKKNTKHLNLESLFTLVRDPKNISNYIPDFLTPPPSTPFPDFKSELETMRLTPHEIVRHDIEWNYQDLPAIPSYAQTFLDTPQTALDDLALQLEAYWNAALESHWTRIRLFLEGDVMLRARHLALGGAEVLFNQLHPTLSFQNHVLTQEKIFDKTTHLQDQGMILVPSVFLGSKIMSMCVEPWQPTMIYAARGSANLWNAPLEPNSALEALLGAGCALVLEALSVPTGTLELAGRLQVAPSNITHHLKRLTRAGLVESHRQGRIVYYRHSHRAEEMLALYE